LFALGNVRILATPWTPSRSVVIPLPPASRRCAAAALAVALLGAAPAARAQPPVSPRFDISRFAIEGATLLDQATLERAVEPFAGGQRSFEDVRAAAKAVEAEYARRG
jgi:hemolysin activation/secretion protein